MEMSKLEFKMKEKIYLDGGEKMNKIFGKSFRIKLLLKMRNFLAPAISERRGKYEQNES